MLIQNTELIGSKSPSNDARINISILYEMNKTTETLIFSCLEYLGESKPGEKFVEPGRKEGNSICTDVGQSIQKRFYSYVIKG